MSISAFAFDPPTGWNDASVFPTYEASEVKVRSDMQELHDQALSFINTLGAELDKEILEVSISSLSSLPTTIYSTKITADHIVLDFYIKDQEDVQGDEWTITTANGGVTISGTLNATTDIVLALGKSSLTVS